LEQRDLTEIIENIPSKATEYTFFSSAHGTHSRIDHVLSPETSLNKFKRIEIT
jgi:hypothetical protein